MANEYYGQQNPDTYLTSPENSTPKEVRRYIAHLLIQNHGQSIVNAQEIASNWIYGRGSEFYQYDLETFKDMFGDEVGMILYLYSRDITPGGRIKGVWQRFWESCEKCCVQ